MSKADATLMAHLMRRAGFGATRDELESYLDMGYEATVEALLDPRDPKRMPDDIIRRYHVDQSEQRIIDCVAAYWIYRMVSTDAPLQEKMALFWHGLFATGERKVNQAKTMWNQIEMYCRHGMGSFRTLLVELSRDPAMLYWLDNNENHKGAINENYGRELLELFSMGIGNYTEQDIKECARAFTGWTIESAEYMALRSHKASIWPYGRVAWQFDYRDSDHDDGEKAFLGERGRFNGEDIIDVIVKNPAAAQFIGRRLFQFFVADEVDEEGQSLIDRLAESYFESCYDMRSVLRTLFNSELFKSERVRYARVKSPVELVVGTLRLVQDFQWPRLEIYNVALATNFMGQELLNPPSVEGWHEGPEWVDSGALVERVNFAASHLGNAENPGVRAIADRLADMDGGVLSPDQVVDGCLDLIGPVAIDESTRAALVATVGAAGDLDLRDAERADESRERVADALRLIVSTREFQLA